MSLYAQTVPQHIKMLQNLDRWLEAAVAYAETRKFDADTLLLARLAPDQYALGRQVQMICDNAKFCAARLTGTTAPSHPDTETTIPALRARIAAVIAYLETVNEAAFEGASARRIELNFAPGMDISGEDYLRDMASPNLYFHLTLAYSILRHNGVPLGKRDFLGSIALAPKA